MVAGCILAVGLLSQADTLPERYRLSARGLASLVRFALAGLAGGQLVMAAGGLRRLSGLLMLLLPVAVLVGRSWAGFEAGYIKIVQAAALPFPIWVAGLASLAVGFFLVRVYEGASIWREHVRGARLLSSRQMDRTLRRIEPKAKSHTFSIGGVRIPRSIETQHALILGSAGMGKSSLLSILGMLDNSWSGRFDFLGHAVHDMKPRHRVELNKKYIGFVFQQYHLLDDLTVAENLDIPLSYRDVRRSERQAMVADTLDRFQIVGKKDLFPSQLSGGQQQLVGVARAVIAKPRLLLADEPTGNLHSEQGREIMELFRKLNGEGTTIIQVTHSESNAAYSDRIIRLADGWIQQPDPTAAESSVG